MFGWLDWGKLKQEWKTVAVAVVGIVIEVYDSLLMTGMVDLPSLFPEVIRPFVAPTFLVLMLLLRKWKYSTEADDGRDHLP
jgi:hypothetical protein